MKLLLDTHILLWSRTPRRLSRRVARALEDQRNEIWVSPMSAWEILTLSQKGRLKLKGGPREWFRDAVSHLGAFDAAVTQEVALASEGLPLPHRDPIDTLLVASAIVYGLTLVTADRNLIAAKACPVLSNL